MEKLSQFINYHRVAKNISKRKLAILANISHTEIHRIENGERKNPSPHVLRAISLALNVPYNDLMCAANYIDSTLPQTIIKPQPSVLEDLNEFELDEVKHYIKFLISKRK